MEKESWLMRCQKEKILCRSIRLAQERVLFLYHHSFDLHKGKSWGFFVEEEIPEYIVQLLRLCNLLHTFCMGKCWFYLK